MTLNSTLDVLYLVLSIAVAGVAFFVCWAMYEIARMLRQANEILTDTREKINRLERAVLSIKERFESATGYLGMLAEGGKSLLSFLHKRKGDEEEEEDDIVSKKRVRKKI